MSASRGSGTDSAAAVLPYGREPRPGVISAGQPRGHEWPAVAAAGVRTVVDIRESWEPRGHAEAEAVEAAGLRYVHIPFGHGHIPDTTFDRVRAVMRENGGTPVVVHCASGNRVGAALLPWWILDEGMSEDEAVQAAVSAGLASRGLAVTALDYARRKALEEEQEVAA